MKRLIIRDFINGESKPLKEMGLKGCEITGIYTILQEDKLYPNFDGQTGEKIDKTKCTLDDVYINHGVNLFVEDVLHDWYVRQDRLYFNGHSGEKGSLHDLLVEYEIQEDISNG